MPSIAHAVTAVEEPTEPVVVAEAERVATPAETTTPAEPVAEQAAPAGEVFAAAPVQEAASAQVNSVPVTVMNEELDAKVLTLNADEYAAEKSEKMAQIANEYPTYGRTDAYDGEEREELFLMWTDVDGASDDANALFGSLADLLERMSEEGVSSSYQQFPWTQVSTVSAKIGNKAVVPSPAGTVFKAYFDSFEDLLLGTWAVDNYLNMAQVKDAANPWLVPTTRVFAEIHNAEIVMSHSLVLNGTQYCDVDLVFEHCTMVRDDDTENSFNSNVNANDDGYFQLVSMKHVAVYFDGCDFYQNIQHGTQGAQGNANVDLTFNGCNFNGDRVLNMEEQLVQRNDKSDAVDASSAPNDRDIWKSYQGDNIGNLTIINCVNLRNVNATGSNAYNGFGSLKSADGNDSVMKVINCTFVKDRRSFVKIGEDEEGNAIYGELGSMLLFGQKFAEYYFEQNTWSDGISLYVEAFKDAKFNAIARDEFYSDMAGYNGSWSETAKSKWDSEVNNISDFKSYPKYDNNTNCLGMDQEAYWCNPVYAEDGVSAIDNVVINASKAGGVSHTSKVAGNVFYIYHAAKPAGVEDDEENNNPETPETPETPEEPTVPETPEEPVVPPAAPVNPDMPDTPGDSEDPIDETEDNLEDSTNPVDPDDTLVPTGIPGDASLTPVNLVIVPPAPAPAPAAPAAVAIPADPMPLAAPEEILDDGTPLSPGRSWALYNFALMELAIFESLMLLFGAFMRVRREEEDDDAPRKKPLPRVTSVPVAIISVIAFVLTEDITCPLVLIDEWTPLMLLFAIVQTGMVMLSRKSYREQDEDERTTVAAV